MHVRIARRGKNIDLLDSGVELWHMLARITTSTAQLFITPVFHKTYIKTLVFFPGQEQRFQSFYYLLSPETARKESLLLYSDNCIGHGILSRLFMV